MAQPSDAAPLAPLPTPPTHDEVSPALQPRPSVSSPSATSPHPPHPPTAVSHPAKTDEGCAATGRLQSVSASSYGSSRNRDEMLAKLNQDRTYSHIRAWEENAKAKSTNKFDAKIAKINAWENTKNATSEAKLRKSEEKLEKKKAVYVERMKNEISEVHRKAEEKRAVAEAKRGEEHVQAEEMSAKYRATGHLPNKFLCFGG